MTKLIFCYQFETFETANEFIMRLYHQYIMAKSNLPKIDMGRISYSQVIVESFENSKDNLRLLEIMNLLADSCNAYIRFAGPKT